MCVYLHSKRLDFDDLLVDTCCLCHLSKASKEVRVCNAFMRKLLLHTSINIFLHCASLDLSRNGPLSVGCEPMDLLFPHWPISHLSLGLGSSARNLHDCYVRISWSSLHHCDRLWFSQFLSFIVTSGASEQQTLWVLPPWAFSLFVSFMEAWWFWGSRDTE